MVDLADFIKIYHNDDKEFNLSRKSCKLSEFISNYFEKYPDETKIKIKEINSETLEKVVEYLTKFEGVAPEEIEKPIISTKMIEIVDPWSAEFVDSLNQEVLVGLVIAANILIIKPLVDLCIAKIATLCKDRTDDDVLKIFGINDIISEEDKTKLIEENQWVKENI